MTTEGFQNISFAVHLKAIAVTVLSVWFILSSIDLLQDIHLLEYSSTEMNRSVEEVLDSFGKAIRSSENAQAKAVNPSLSYPYPFYFCVEESSSAPRTIQRFEREAKLSVKGYETHKLHQVFLI